MSRDIASEATGVRYGRWVVLGYGGRNKRGDIMLACKCDCGTCKTIRKESLVYGVSKSCGCLKSDLSAERVSRNHPGEAAFMVHYRGYRDGAKKRGYEFIVSENEFLVIASKDCVYCGAEPVEFKSRQISIRKMSGYVANGVDRVDNSLGYFVDNLVPCCSACNQSKSAKTKEQFIKMCKAVAEHNS